MLRNIHNCCKNFSMPTYVLQRERERKKTISMSQVLVKSKVGELLEGMTSKIPASSRSLGILCPQKRKKYLSL